MSERRKVYAWSTRDLEDGNKYDMSLKGAEDFFDAVSQANDGFWWEYVVESTVVDWDFQGKVELAKKLFDDRSSLTFE